MLCIYNSQQIIQLRKKNKNRVCDVLNYSMQKDRLDIKNNTQMLYFLHI